MPQLPRQELGRVGVAVSQVRAAHSGHGGDVQERRVPRLLSRVQRMLEQAGGPVDLHGQAGRALLHGLLHAQGGQVLWQVHAAYCAQSVESGFRGQALSQGVLRMQQVRPCDQLERVVLQGRG